jgi:hypothetical protein
MTLGGYQQPAARSSAWCSGPSNVHDVSRLAVTHPLKTNDERRTMATPERTGGNLGGIGLGGILVIVGILLALFWSVWIGIVVALVGLIAFGGFARGRWY